MTFLGLSASEFTDIHVAVAQAMAYVHLPIQLRAPQPDAVDPLYGEAVGGTAATVPYADIHASLRLKPKPEELTKFGLQTSANLLGFIYRQAILDWETAHGTPFVLTTGMTVVFQGVTYNITEVPEPDFLPVGDGATLDYIGRVFAATTKPSLGR